MTVKTRFATIYNSITKTDVCTHTLMIHSVLCQKMSASFTYKFFTHNLSFIKQATIAYHTIRKVQRSTY